MINRIDFGNEMKRMSDTFGNNAFSPGRLDAIWEIVEDLEVFELRKIVKGFIRRARQAPLPEDFEIAAKSFRKASIRVEDPLVPDCRICADVGFIQAAYHDYSNRTLMRCPCERGIRHPRLMIPVWEKGMEQIFRWWPCDASWFEPIPHATSASEFLVHGTKQIENWLARLRYADKHWRAEIEKQQKRNA